MAAPKRWARFQSHATQAGFGILDGDRITEYAGDMFAGPRPTGNTVGLDACTLLAPCAPTKMIALWNNFRALAAKLGKQAPVHPLFLIKPASCIIGPNEARPAGGLHGQDRGTRVNSESSLADVARMCRWDRRRASFSATPASTM